MGWRNQKNWQEKNIAATPEQSADWSRVNDGDVTRYVTLLPDIDLNVDRLYGLERASQPELWSILTQAQNCCARVVYFKEFNEASKQGAYLLIVDPLTEGEPPIIKVPLQDVSEAGDTMVKKVMDIIAERARVARLREDLRQLHRDAMSMQQEGQKNAQTILSYIDTVARVAYGTTQKSAPSLKESQLDSLMKRWSRVDVFQAPVETECIDKVKLRLTIDDLIMTYAREGTRGIHKSLDGTQVHLGKFVVDIGFNKKDVIKGVLAESYLTQQVYGTMKNTNISVLHPHIKRGDVCPFDKALYYGSCCLGTYSDALKQCAERGDIYGTAEIMWDYLTSCSEQGWYTHFMWWMPREEALKYCKCGRLRADIAAENALCGCGMARTEDWHSGQDTGATLSIDPSMFAEAVAVPTQEVR